MKIKHLTFIVSIVLLFYACSHEIAAFNPDFIANNAGNPIVTNPVVTNPIDTTSILKTNTCNPDTVYFASQFFPLIQSSCAMSGCHNTVSRAAGVVLTDYTNIMKVVRAGDPNNSKLYKSLFSSDDRMPRSPVPPFTQAQITMVYKWIQQGAKNNACSNAVTSSCVTTNMSFANNILPIFASNCNGCHNATAPSGGINLTTYAGVKSKSSRIVGSIAHSAGYIPMPSSTTKLSDCDINKITAWISQGAINN
jgi:hypothetical protein